MRFREFVRRGEPAIWLAGTGLGIAVLLILAMVALILWNGLGLFWPKPISELTLRDGTVLLGEIVAREGIPAPGTTEHNRHHRLQLKLGNRDITGADFRWIDEDDIVSRTTPGDAVYVERSEYGPFIGRVVKLVEGDREIASGTDAVLAALPDYLEKAARDRAARRQIESDEIGGVNHEMEQVRLRARRLDFEAARRPGTDQMAELFAYFADRILSGTDRTRRGSRTRRYEGTAGDL